MSNKCVHLCVYAFTNLCVYAPSGAPGAWCPWQDVSSFRLVNEGQLPVPYVPLITTQYNLTHTHTHTHAHTHDTVSTNPFK